jgi:transposase-like protein
MNPREVIFEEMKRECLKMYVNGLGFRAIERVKNVHHPTIMNWVKPEVLNVEKSQTKNAIIDRI